VASLIWPKAQDRAARAALAAFSHPAKSERANGALIERADLFAATGALAAAGVGPVSVTQPIYVFEAASAAGERLAAAVRKSA
jgi:hypothetical protein